MGYILGLYRPWKINWRLLFMDYVKPGSSSDSFQVPLGYILGSVD